MKKLTLIIFLLTLTTAVFGQRRHDKDTLSRQQRKELLSQSDTLQNPGDSTMVTVDSLEMPQKRKPKSIVDTPIEYKCTDSLLISFDDKRVFLYGTSNVKTEGMELSSDHMRMEMETHSIFAEGNEDSTTHEISGKPVFKDNNEEFTARIIKYNFERKEGYVLDVVTQQQSGYLFGEVTKMHANREIHLKNGHYTTCELEHPHFYLHLTRAKVIPGDKIVSGPAYFVLLDVPVYILGLPFGIFPNSRKQQNGVIIPSYGEETRRGFYLNDGGYYFAFSDYADLELLGSVYSRGSWGAKLISKYKLRYKFSGNLNLQYSHNVTGIKKFKESKNGDVAYNVTNSYSIRWNFTQDPKANPTSSFNINVNYDKQNYDRYNATSLSAITKSTTSSSINYSKSMFNGKANLTASCNMTQNLYDSTISFSSFPSMNFSYSTFYPFKRKIQIGSQKWYEKITSNFNMDFQNQVPTIKDEYLFKQEMYDQMRYGIKYAMPLKTSFNLLKYIQVSPSLQYTGRLYPNYIIKHREVKYGIDNKTGELAETSTGNVNDTINGINHVYDFSANVSASTTIYGMFQFNKLRHLKAIRHVVTPTVGFSWRPDFSEDFWGFYKQDPNNHDRKYCIYENGLMGYPGSGKSSMLSLGLGNKLEMKVKGKNDTIEGQYTKIKILENFNLSSGINLAQDTCKLSQIRASANTRLFDKININMNGTFDPYMIDDKGHKTRHYLASQTHGKTWARLTNASMTTGFTWDSKTLGKKKKDEKEKAANQYAEDEAQAEVDEEGNIVATAEEVEQRKKESKLSKKEQDSEFQYYSVPWSLSANYSLNYSKPNNNPGKITQTLGFNGSVTFTEKWSMTASTHFDFERKKLTSTEMSVTRQLHCFGLSFHIVPFGTYKSYNFRLAINSSIFQGIEYKRQHSWHDN